MITVSKSITTETGHRLPNYAGNCQHFHGHSYKWIVTCMATVDERGIAVDFKDIKTALRTIIHNELDHAFVLGAQDPLVVNYDRGHINRMFAPSTTRGAKPRLVITPYPPTAEWFAIDYGRKLKAHFDHLCKCGDIQETFVVSLEVKETENSSAVWTNGGTVKEEE